MASRGGPPVVDSGQRVAVVRRGWASRASPALPLAVTTRVHWPSPRGNMGAVGHARLLLTCGLPGAGKTTLARKLAADRGALRLTQDEWLIALGSTPWDASTREKLDQELWRLAQGVLVLGLSVIVDFGLWGRIERDEMRLAARRLGVGVELHYLDVPAEELWRRIEARNAEPPWSSYPIGREHLHEWLGIFQAPDSAELALFDPPQAEPSGTKPGS